MDYSFEGDLSEDQSKLMRDWLAECWRKIDDEEAAPDFLTYIMVGWYSFCIMALLIISMMITQMLIKKHSTMGEIQNELKDLDVDDIKSK